MIGKRKFFAGALFAMIAAFSARGRLALAVTSISPPAGFGGHAVTALIVHDPYGSGEWVYWQDKVTSSCDYTFLSKAPMDAGLTTDYVIHGSSGNDFIEVASGSTSFCGYPVDPLKYNGHWLDIHGEDGDDQLLAGSAGLSDLFGGNGNDVIISGRPDVIATGDAGNDSIDVGGSGHGADVQGNDGNDCIMIDSTTSPYSVSCGAGTDTWKGPGTRPSDCESTFTSGCCSGIIC
jgi:Ca2+-binding RTX toxin-like protein